MPNLKNFYFYYVNMLMYLLCFFITIELQMTEATITNNSFKLN